ncbi:hypothetical protein MKZ38_006029 [Zalerion maritima]|uniref:ATP-grasp domain-containing protein n=1 Tax=Zalerion maritima TaxID=339359 RepID=A0AAD5WPZ6_9PEZI|nr:hypothetical protein MKZ38_006029 [Zalerion maritima]
MESLRVLLIGNGGREHALAWKLSQSPRVESIIAVPGNGGTATCPKTTNSTEVKDSDFPGLVEFAKKNNINLVVPGPEVPLVAGITSFFSKAGIACFGPSIDGARLEGSKTFSKDFMRRHNIPTAAYENFSDYSKASAYLDSVGHDVVIKATGLAAGKGVLIPTTKEEAQAGLKSIMLDKDFGDAGSEVVIEEYLEGDELSILTFSDGYTFLSLPPAQDHKRIFDGDQGPNTGGMGCYSPTNIATKELIARIEKEVLAPTFAGMRKEKVPFRGCLFTGLMITVDGPKTLEYNVRFGDPECQTLLPLLESDLAEIMLACVDGYLDTVDLKVSSKFSTTVVLASGGYPGSYPKNVPMMVQSPPDNITIFHAGTKLVDGELLTSGGRVIAANAIADGGLEAAVAKAYEGVKLIQFDKMFYRKDIAHRAFRKTAAKEQLTYAQAGVSIDAGNEFVERIKKAVASTKRPGADAEIGGFGGELDLSKAGYTGAPVVVAAIDGVGTKLMIAQAMNNHSTVGIDLVAMNVNDLVVQGAEPVMFVDYYGCSKLNPATGASFVEGVAAGCRDAGCALVGGETAEMPGMYKEEDYDAAGAAIGVMAADKRLPQTGSMAEGDVLLGLASSGVHSNGFSLLRRIIERENVSYTDKAPWDTSKDVGTSLLTPTRIYVKPLLRLASQGLVKGLAHITGGGLTENVPRMLPASLAAEIDVKTWEAPAVFKWLKSAGNVAPAEMARTFNNGIGMVAVTSAGNAQKAKAELETAGEIVYQIGRLVSRSGDGCTLLNLDSWA